MIFRVLLRRLCVVGVFASVLFALAAQAAAVNPPPPSSQGRSSVALAGLPEEAREVVTLIRRGGPFRYERDGAVFGNFEGVLPARSRGYYREYTVPTPGLRHRGARRIVAGRGGELYYTDDHYKTFRHIRE
jgi:ribonuclease T1